MRDRTAGDGGSVAIDRWDTPLPDCETVPYHRRFASFRDETIAHTDALFLARPSRLPADEARAAFSDWASSVSSAYDVPAPTVEWNASVRSVGGGRYLPDSAVIHLSHVSVTTLLHEFRHHLQSHGAPVCAPDVEDDARAWSLSLFHQVRPRLFADLVQQGRIAHMSVTDLS